MHQDSTPGDSTVKALFLTAPCCAAVVMMCSQAAFAEPIMQVQTLVTDLAGNEISSIPVGDQYKVQTYVTDIRNPPESRPDFQGVFSAGANIGFDPALSFLDTSQTVDFGSFFSLIQEVDLMQGRVMGYGSTSSARGPGNAPQFLFAFVLTATAPGLQVFTPQLDQLPDHEYNMYLVDPPLPISGVSFIGDSLQIVPEPSSCVLAGLGALAIVAVRRRAVRGQSAADRELAI
jgi:hypothetical protein